ncbi:MAG TPA: peptidylprolyl isomerase [Bryobacteraceae bacterium]|nr:peptidylprolyl isomerase [Bryobacteraceae bacterium]
MAVALCATALQAQNNPTYRFITNLGNIDVVLTPSVAPKTVANFLSYVNAGYYNNTIFHRSVPGFVVQAGGYQYFPNQTPNVVAIPQSPAIPNEFNVTNATGTIAMALVSGNSNSATSQWFFNLANNGTNANALDSQMFTVFGQTNAAGIKVLNLIAAQPVFDYSATYGSDFSTLPLSGGQTGTFIVVQSIVPVPTITSAGFLSAASYAPNSTTGISPGEILTVFGEGMGPSQLATFTVPASGPIATNLAGTQVFFNGQAAPLIYTSNGQLSVIAPYSIGDLPTVSVSMSYNGIQSGALNFPVKAANPAIFTLNASGSGDGVIVKYQGSSYTVISASSPASPGDVLTLFGEGYGAATTGSAVPDGTIVTSTLPVPANPTTLLIDGNQVTTSYVGGAPYEINAVLQVNFTVPQLAPGSHTIQLKVSTPNGDRISPSTVTIQTK